MEALKQAGQLFDRAIELDPKFALAFAHLSRLESWIYQSHDPAPPRRQRAREHAQHALQLQPDCPEGHLALGFSYYYGDRNYDSALNEFAIAQRGMPNDSEVYLAIGAIQRRQGRWTESTANLENAARLDPKNIWPLQNLAFNYQMTRNYVAARSTLNRALQLDPKALSILLLKIKYDLDATGDLSQADTILSVLSSLATDPDKRLGHAGIRMNVFFLQRKFAEMLQETQKYSDTEVANHPEAAVAKYVGEGIARLRMQQNEAARAAFLKAKENAERFVRESPNDPARHSRLAEVLAYLGEKDAAIAEARRGMELRPESADAFDGPEQTEMLARVYAIVGEQEEAITLLDGLLARPSAVTVATLKTSPIWDNLRDNPRFHAMLKKYDAST
jgi:tetratricopeptide (TPR) repeat protein